MAALPNRQHEEFCRLLNSGMHKTKAYLAVGYKCDPQGASSSRLAGRLEIKVRLEELKRITDDATVSCMRVAIDRDKVMTGLTIIAENTKLSAAARVRAYELLGKELGMFRDATGNLMWDGDPRNLTTPQLQVLLRHLEHLAISVPDDAVIEFTPQLLKGDDGSVQ